MTTPISERAREVGRSIRREPVFAPLETTQSSVPDVISVRQALGMVLERWGVVLGFGVATFAAVMSITLASGMEFVSSGRLYLGELDSKGRTAAGSVADLELTAGAEGQVASEIEILKSRTLVTQAVLESGINVSITPARQEPTRYWKWLSSKRDPELLDAGFYELRAKNARLAGRYREPQRFTARFVSDTEYELRDFERKLVGRGNLEQPLKTNGLELTLVAGMRRPRRGSEYELTVQPLEGVVNGVLQNLEVTAPKVVGAGELVNVVTLEYTASSPRLAAALLDQLMQAYLKERQTWKTEDATAAEAFVSSQLATMRDSLDQVQRKLADYRTNNRVVVLDDEAQAMIDRIAKYEEQRLEARLELAGLGEMKKSLAKNDAPLGAYLLGEANDGVLQGMATSLTQARQKLTDLQSRFNDVAPNVKEQQAQVDAQLETIRNYVSNRHRRAEEHLSALNGIIGQFEQRLKTVPGAELGLAELSRESDVYSRTYSYLLERQQQAAIVKASRLSKNRVLDAPQVPLREDSPKLALRLMSGLIGILIGATLVVVRNVAAGAVQNRADLQRIIGSRPILADIPRRPRRRRGESAEAEQESLLESRVGDTGFRFAESFRTLRANLARLLRGAEPGGKIVVITSPDHGDGKSTCASWLAAVLAADGRLVLRVDADLRKAPAPTSLAAETRDFERGLHGFLVGDGNWRDSIGTVASRHGDHDLIVTGDGLQPEALSGERMSRFLKEARQHYDFILLDCPSFPFVSDALVLAGNAHAVLSVFRLQHSSRERAREHLQGLAGSAAHGILVNDAGTKPTRAPKFTPRSASSPPGQKRLERAHAGRSMRWAAAALAFALMTGLLYSSVGSETLARFRPLFVNPPWIE